jgi:glycosyltransferase involved in cell wall biosynthesis
MMRGKRPTLVQMPILRAVPAPAPTSKAIPGIAPGAAVLLDISRLIWRSQRVGPTGIDRVELAYAEHFITGDSGYTAYAVLHLFGFLFAVKPAGARQFIQQLSARWRGNAPRDRRSHGFAVARAYLKLLCAGWMSGFGLRRLLRSHVGPPIFMVVSTHHISLGFAINRIRRKFQAQTVCMIHDVIPIDFPEYCPAGWDRRYRRVYTNSALLFDGVIVNSETTARSLRAHLYPNPAAFAAVLNIRVALLGASAFPRARTAPSPSEVPYFVVLGTIEPRKNHLMLLNLWTRLALTMRSPPRLIIIGSRGWENEQVVDMLERSRRLCGLVQECNRMADADIGALLANARAVLVPSITEGFGLPLAEALSSNVPAICSDIPAFREVGGDAPEYLDPLDLGAWLTAVMDYSQFGSTRRARQMRRLVDWQSLTWEKHFESTHQLLADLRSEALAVNADRSDRSRRRSAAGESGVADVANVAGAGAGTGAGDAADAIGAANGNAAVGDAGVVARMLSVQ